jgi:hypothetical protein
MLLPMTSARPLPSTGGFVFADIVYLSFLCLYTLVTLRSIAASGRELDLGRGQTLLRIGKEVQDFRREEVGAGVHRRVSLPGHNDDA